MRQQNDPAPEPETTAVTLTQTNEGAQPASAWRTAPSDCAAFLRGFLRHPGQVGSVIPSSARLEQRLVRCARVAEASVVVELGPGTGGTTRALLGAMRADARLLGIELDPTFQAHVKATIHDARFMAHLGSAQQIAEVLAAYRLAAPDVVVSGIPFSTMPPDVAQRIAAVIARVLAPGGRLVAYQVRAHVARYATPYLGVPQRQWEWLNIPPVRVFTWTKNRAAQ